MSNAMYDKFFNTLYKHLNVKDKPSVEKNEKKKEKKICHGKNKLHVF